MEVFIIIFNDRKCPDLQPNQLYNRQLGQINELAQLKRFKGDKRIVSIKDKFREWQVEHIVKVLNRIFQ